MITVSIKETREGTIEFETQEEYDQWVEDGEDLDAATCDEVSTNITHPDGSISGDYTDYPQNW